MNNSFKAFHPSDFNPHQPTMAAEAGKKETLVPLDCKQLRKGYQGQREKSAAFPWVRQTSFPQGSGCCSSWEGNSEKGKVKTTLGICFRMYRDSDFTLHHSTGGLGYGG